MKNTVWLATAALALALVACPTPTNSTPPPPPGASYTPPPVTPPPTGTDLVISEVGSSYYFDGICWFEVYNPTSSPIDLAGYQVRAREISSVNGSAPTPNPATFSLPSFTVNPGAYIVIGGEVTTDVFNTNKSVYISNAPNFVPYWFGSGFVELLKGGQTVDFVRFGTNTTAPTTPGNWGTTNAPAFDTTTPFSYGRSLVRAPGADTDSAADWSARDFATPGGQNDVPAGAVDADNDGIPDSAEVSGGGYNGLNLYAMGARTGKRDLFIEVDSMTSSDAGLNPQREALDKVVAAFAAKNIAVHFDAGDAFATGFNPAAYNLLNTSRTLPFATSISLSPAAGLSSSVYALKAQNMDFARSLIFHYLVVGSSQKADGTSGSSGLAEIVGNDFLISFGGWGLKKDTPTNTNLLINFQANTIMHELGHNLGLRHGGDEDTNYKPNYYSIMNYDYQLNCLGAASGANAGDRYYFRYGIKGITTASAMLNGPTGTSCLMDYSNGSSSNLDEFALNENNGIGRGTGFIDWNNNGGAAETNVAADINADTAGSTLHDFDDWGNVILPFAHAYAAFNNGVQRSRTVPLFPASNDVQPSAAETAPSDAFFRQLRELQAR